MAKVRVYELAKELGVEPKTLLNYLKERGEFVRSLSSTVEPRVVLNIKANFQQAQSLDGVPAPSVATATHSHHLIQPAAKSSLPMHPQRRRAIVVVGPRELNDNKVVGIDPLGEVAILNVPSSRPTAKSAELARRLFDQGLLHPGATLVQSPFNHNLYELAEDAASAFMLQKSLLFTEFCQLLGAKSVKLEQIVIFEDGADRAVKADIKLPIANASLDYRGTSEEKLWSLLQVDSNFEGNEADVGLARELLDASGLTADQHMAHLLELRISENRVRDQKLQINLTRELGHNLDVAARASGWFQMAANAAGQRKLTDRTEIRMDVRVTF